MDYLHPTMQDALRSIAPPKQSAEESYRNLLKNFDWLFEFSDSHSVWANGFNDLSRLRRMQKEVDPTGVIWMQYRPDSRDAPLPSTLVIQVGTVEAA